MTIQNLKGAVLALVAAVGLAAGVWMAARTPGVGAPAIGARTASVATVLPVPKPLGPFSLIDQEGRTFDRDRLVGKWSFLFLGYTHCPDICPMTLATLRQVRERLAAQPDLLDGTQFVLVSVDPERDSPAQLTGYIAHFGDRFLGVTGTDDQLQALTRELGALYLRPSAGQGGEYTVDHTASVFLVDPGAGLHAIFSAPHAAESIAQAFSEIRRGAP